MNQKKITNFIVFLFISISSIADDDVIEVKGLSLGDYLLQVSSGNLAGQSSARIKEGSQDRFNESNILFYPILYGVGFYSRDEKPQASSILSGKKSVNNYTIGINQLTQFGLQAKLYYSLSDISIEGVNSQYIKTPSYYEMGPSLELSFSLWKNKLGRETKNLSTMIEASTRASYHQENFKLTILKIEAEIAYWKLYQSSEVVHVQQESLDRAIKLKNWNVKRVYANLGDKTDLLQSEAAVQLKNLELQSAIDDEKSAKRQFNLLRGLESEIILEKLNTIPHLYFASYKEPVRLVKEDRLAANEIRKMSIAKLQSEREKYIPMFDVYANLSLTGQNAVLSDSLSDSFKGKYPKYEFGIKFSMPLLLSGIDQIKEGYLKEIEGSELNYKKKLFDENDEWIQLNVKISDAKKRLTMTEEIEKIQSEKLKHEKDRQSRGRSTTFQVLMFEQEFANAQLNRIRLETEILNLTARLRSFGGGQ